MGLDKETVKERIERIENCNIEEMEEFLKNDIGGLDLHTGNRVIKTIIIKLINEIRELKRLSNILN